MNEISAATEARDRVNALVETYNETVTAYRAYSPPEQQTDEAAHEAGLLAISDALYTPDPAATARARSGQHGNKILWRHVKRGTVYEELGRAELQVSRPSSDPTEGDTLVVYRGEDGKLWTRPEGEFKDGRFERIAGARRPGDTLTALRLASVARQAEWGARGAEPLPILFKATELGGEAGEVLNVVKKLERERLGWQGSRATVEQLADELADLVICADLLAEPYGIDLAAAIVRKFNATSEQRGLTTRMGEAVLAWDPNESTMEALAAKLERLRITKAARDVLAERRRQIDAEGWTPDHDDVHDEGEMARAAACYCMVPEVVAIPVDLWPWDASWFKPTTLRRNRVKAAAMLLADIERLDRAEARVRQQEHQHSEAGAP